MNKIIIIVEGFDIERPKNANSIVADKIRQQLNKLNVNVDIISSRLEHNVSREIIVDKLDGGTLYSIACKDNDDWINSAKVVFDKDFWEEKNYDAIFSISNPIQFSMFSSYVRTKYHVPLLQYYLDPHSMSEAVRHRMLFFPVRFFRDVFIHASASKVYVTNELYNYSTYKILFSPFKDKIIPLGIPVVPIEGKFDRDNLDLDKKIRISYFGKFYKDIRNPDKIFDFFEKQSNIVLNIFGLSKTEYENEFGDTFEYKNIKFQGYVSRERVKSELKESDIVLNVGNKVSNQLPSKVIEYLEHGKKILNVFYLENDTSKKFLEHYDKSLSINYSLLSNKETIDKFEKFIYDEREEIEYMDSLNPYREIFVQNICEKIMCDLIKIKE